MTRAAADLTPCPWTTHGRRIPSWGQALALERQPLKTLEHVGAGADLFPVTSLVAGPMLVIAAPDLAHRVLRAPAGRYLAGRANQRMLPLLPPDTLLTLDGRAHRDRRRELASRLGGAHLQSMRGHISVLVTRELDNWPVGRPFALLPRLRSLTFSIAACLLTGVTGEPELARLSRGLKAGLRPYALLARHQALRRLGAASPQAAAKRGHLRFAHALREVGHGLDRHLSADEVFALLLAGQDTTATALAWALIQLAHMPTAVDHVATSSDTQRPMIEAIIRETLRMHPPLIDIVRQPAHNVELAGRHVPAGSQLMICPALIGRSSLHNHPDQFNPSRFLTRHPDVLSWIPFGGGERRCIGSPLAMLELREVLTQVAQRFELTPSRARLETPRLYGTAVVPNRGAEVVLTRRARRALPASSGAPRCAEPRHGGQTERHATVGP